MPGKLEIFIFTYNRAPSLLRTLRQLADSPLNRFRITVLDNHSTDSTPQVCQEATRILPFLRIVRHPKNIGGLANYLRAVELAEAEYTWIICDDDAFDFSHSDDLFKALEDGQTDIISASVEGHNLTRGARANLLSFSLKEPFFFCHSFVPSMIFRTSLFHSELIRAGYDNIETMFPHFPFLIHLAEQDCSIYVTQEIIIRKSHNVGYSAFRFMAGWVKSSSRFSHQQLKKKVIAEVFGGKQFLQTILFSILVERQFRPARFLSDYRKLCLETAQVDRSLWLKLLAFAPLVHAPALLHHWLWKLYGNYRRKKGLPLPNFDEER